VGVSITDPIKLADLVLALAVSGIGEMVFVEPSPTPGSYAITCERGNEVVKSIVIDEAVAHATIARLAIIAKLDLATTHAIGGVVRASVGHDAGEVVVTLRPGARLRADVAPLPTRRHSRPS